MHSDLRLADPHFAMPNPIGDIFNFICSRAPHFRKAYFDLHVTESSRIYTKVKMNKLLARISRNTRCRGV
jgi:hypothetical protein